MADTQDLAALQQLLQSQQNDSTSQVQQDATQMTGAPSQDQNQEQVPEAPAGPSAEEIAALQKQKEIEDAKKIEEQLQKMNSEIKETPQYQAMIDQKQSHDQASADRTREERSKTIFQLKRLDK